MNNYRVTIKRVAQTTIAVTAEDEGAALDKAREISEEMDINQFNLGEELESVCQS